jgi:hypothetical protein
MPFLFPAAAREARSWNLGARRIEVQRVESLQNVRAIVDEISASKGQQDLAQGFNPGLPCSKYALKVASGRDRPAYCQSICLIDTPFWCHFQGTLVVAATQG